MHTYHTKHLFPADTGLKTITSREKTSEKIRLHRTQFQHFFK